MDRAIEKEKGGFLVKVEISLFLLAIMGRYVNLTCIPYTSNFRNKWLLINDKIRKRRKYI